MNLLLRGKNMRLLTKDANSKIKKSNALARSKGQSIEYYNLTLTSEPVKVEVDGKVIEFDPCPSADLFGCRDACLREAGRGVMSNVRQGRQGKLVRFVESHANKTDTFLKELVSDCISIERKIAKGQIDEARIRLNTISDLPWLFLQVNKMGVAYDNIMAAFPTINFYDYTKVASRFGKKLPSNYCLVMSDSNEPKAQRQIDYALERGAKLATVFDVEKDEPLPKTHRGMTVVDADKSDGWMFDTTGQVVGGLRAKGNKLKKDLRKGVPINFVFRTR